MDIKNKDHQKLVDDILFAFGSMPDVRVWTRVVGLFRSLYSEAKIKVGTNGETDIGGIISPEGRWLVIEVKTGSGRLSKDQKAYRKMMIAFGALYIEARSVEQALTDFRRLR